MTATSKTHQAPDEDESEGLRIHTLAGTYWAAHQVVQILHADSVNTVDQLIRHVHSLERGSAGRTQLVRLLRALHDLLAFSNQLGMTTLVKPLDHPLVTRHLIPRE